VTDRRVEYLPLDEVQRAPRNAKEHDAEMIEGSITRFGLADLPVLDDRTGRLVSGHGRLDDLTARRAAGQDPPGGVKKRKDGTWLVPVIRGWASRSDPDAEAYVVIANESTTRGGWDDPLLGQVLADLAEQDADLLALTGFTDEDIAALLGEGEAEPLPGLTDPDDVPDAPVEAVTRPGDVWLLGPHRIICGDSRDFDTVSRLLGEVRVNVAFTSPPYASQRAYDESSGFKPIPPNQYVDWFEDVQANVRAVLADDGSWFVNIKEHCEDGQRHLYVKDLTIAHVRRWGWLFVDELCWFDTRNGVPGGWSNRFKDAWEPVFHFSGAAGIKFRPLVNGTTSDDVFDYSRDNAKAGSGSGLLGEKALGMHNGVARPSNVVQIPAGGDGSHSAQFPVALPAWFIRAYSDPGDVVFDPFMGSGTTLIAANREGRVAYGAEISPAYTDTICARYQKHTGDLPILESTGEPHDFLSDLSATLDTANA
jgi:DNA modification methylase